MTHAARRFAAVLAVAGLAAGCRAGPDSRSSSADVAPITAQEVAGLGYTHLLLVAGVPQQQSGDAGAPQYVFLEGDGRPWSSDGTEPSTDPDPVRAVARELAAAEGSGALVLGRPCYHDRARDPGCGPALWTSGRYSEPVVASMAAALERALETRPARPVVLVGYSGGGPLALLIADRVPVVQGVVTLAANLDLAAWTTLHRYRPLDGSLDPLATRSLPRGCEIHIAATEDAIVPPTLIAAAADRRPGAIFWVESDADHTCCWRARWPAIAGRVSAQLRSAGCLGTS